MTTTTSNLSSISRIDTSTQMAAKANPTGTSAKDLQTNFLTMLVTQLKNQDPLNPTDNNQMTSQLAQLNMLDGISNMDKSIKSMVEQMTSANFMNQSSTVGKFALAAGDNLSFDGTNPVVGGVKLTEDATSVLVKITDASGKVVNTVDMGAQKTGLMNFSWDGLAQDGSALPAGAYKLSAQVTNAAGG